ncbi:MAG: efflux RND transporter periplasmic adaptor subunit [Terricaulis sp.]
MNDKSDLLRSLRIERSGDNDTEGSEGGGLPRWILPAAIGVGALIIGFGGAWLMKPAPAAAPTETAADASTVGSASTNSSTQSTAGGLVASGYVVARREATVASETTGRLVEVRVEEGQHVRRGQVIAVLSPTLAQAQFNGARARAAAADADVAEAQRQLNRTTTLSQQGFASDAALTAAQSRFDQAQAQRNAAHADAASAGAQLGYFQIRAPFDGVVVDKAAQVGEMISPLSAGGGFTRTGICTIVDMTSLEIEVDVSESYIARVHEGQKVEANLDAYPDVTFPAHVIATIPSADRSKATVRVRIGFDQLDPRILPEMAISVRFLDDVAH